MSEEKPFANLFKTERARSAFTVMINIAHDEKNIFINGIPRGISSLENLRYLEVANKSYYNNISLAFIAAHKIDLMEQEVIAEITVMCKKAGIE